MPRPRQVCCREDVPTPLSYMVSEIMQCMERRLQEWTELLEARLPAKIETQAEAEAEADAPTQPGAAVSEEVMQRLEKTFEEWLRRLETRLTGLADELKVGSTPSSRTANLGEELKVGHTPSSQARTARNKKALVMAAADTDTDGNIVSVHEEHGEDKQASVSFEVESEGGFSDANSDRSRLAVPGPQSRASKNIPMQITGSIYDDSGDFTKYNPEDKQQRMHDYHSRMSSVQSSWESKASRGRFYLVEEFISHTYFDYFIMSVVILNSALVGAQVHYVAIGGGGESVFRGIEYTCSTVFIVELLLRIIGLGLGKLCAPGVRWWTAFDVFLVTLSITDASIIIVLGPSAEMPGPGASLPKLLKILRLARVMRLLRMLRFMGDLRVMALMIVHSMLSLFWLLCIVAAMLYVVAIVLTQGATDYRFPGFGETPDNYDAVTYRFGSLFTTMYSLFMSFTGGISWGEIAVLMKFVGEVYFAVFLAFIFFMLFSVLNIVTGVFVDGAIQHMQRDRGVLVEKQKRADEAVISHLLSMLEEIDRERNGMLTSEELARCMTKDSVREQLHALQISTRDLSQLAVMLDKDGDGHVDIVEFVEGLQQMRGEAQSFDVHMLMLQNKKVLEMVTDYMRLNEPPLPSDRGPSS